MKTDLPSRLKNPVVICGTGGSGTRVVEQFFEKSGYFMGHHLNETKDAINFQPVLADVINQVLKETRSVDYTLEQLPKPLTKNILQKLSELIREHDAARPEDMIGWGWKNPRFIYMLPFVHALCPEFHFLHVVRDGRDMALSANQNQMNRFYRDLLGMTPERPVDAINSISMWQKVNLGAAAFAEKTRCAYTRVRYEDMCNKPETMASLRKIFGLPDQDLSGLVRPARIGKYLTLPDGGKALEAAAGEGLRFFGYL